MAYVQQNHKSTSSSTISRQVGMQDHEVRFRGRVHSFRIPVDHNHRESNKMAMPVRSMHASHMSEALPNRVCHADTCRRNAAPDQETEANFFSRQS